LQWAMSVPISSGAHSFTMAAGVSPNFSSATGMTATSSTSGRAAIVLSTSIGEMFRPPEMIISLRRSTIFRYPSSSMIPMSPVRSHPSTRTSRVASTLFQ